MDPTSNSGKVFEFTVRRKKEFLFKAKNGSCIFVKKCIGYAQLADLIVSNCEYLEDEIYDQAEQYALLEHIAGCKNCSILFFQFIEEARKQKIIETFDVKSSKELYRTLIYEVSSKLENIQARRKDMHAL